MKFYWHKYSLSLQVNACGSKVDNLIDEIKEQKHNKETEACVLNCIKADGTISARMKCMKQCLPADVFCGFACFDQGLGLVKEQCTTDGSPCYKCMDKCANGAGAVAATSFAVFFSLAVASFMM